MGTVDSASWRKSTYSGTNGGGCVEVADTARHILIRDTTNRGGAVLSIAPDAWRRFTDAVK